MGDKLYVILAMFLGPLATAQATTDANTLRASCLQQEYNSCVAANPAPVSDFAGSAVAWLCNSSDKQAQFTTACQQLVDQFCGQSTTNSFVPKGCPLPKFQAAALMQAIQPTPTPTPVQTPPPGPPATAANTPDLSLAQADLDSCLSSATNAQSCCDNPQSCGGVDTSAQQSQLAAQAKQASESGDSASLQQICGQVSQAGNLSADMNNSFTRVCSAHHNSCSVLCSQYSAKWQAQVGQCTGSCDSDTLNSLISQMDSATSNCNSLQSAEDSYKQTALTQASNAGVGQYCAQAVSGGSNPMASSNQPNPFNNNVILPSSANPSSGSPPVNSVAKSGQGQPVGSSECGTAANVAACMNCANHPEYPSCGGSSDDSVQADPLPGGANEFNNIDPTTRTREARAMNNSLSDAKASASGVFAGGRPSSNNFIGVFPPLDPKDVSGSLLARARIIAAQTGYNTDILHGERGFGGGNARTVAGSGFEETKVQAYSFPSNNQDQRTYLGMDLKKYLPGAEHDPRRGMAALAFRNPEIAPMSVDIFQRITERFHTVCSSNTLLDCR